MKCTIVIFVTLFNLWGCAVQATNSEQSGESSRWLFQCAKDAVVVFSSTFDEPLHITDDTHFADLLYINDKRKCPTGWHEPVDSNFKFGSARIQFLGGTVNERWARVEPEKSQRGNSVLNFGVVGAYQDVHNHETKGRVQMELVGNQGMRNLYVKVRLKLDKNFDILNKYSGEVNWFTITEWWNNGGWGKNPYPFSFAVNLTKGKTKGASLHFAASARVFDYKTKRFEEVWSQVNSDLKVPIGEWMTLEYSVVEGNEKTGRFKLLLGDAQGKKSEVFDITNYTHHPQDPAPDGFSDIQPIKLYTSEQLIKYFSSANKKLVTYWDDLVVVGCKDIDSYCNLFDN